MNLSGAGGGALAGVIIGTLSYGWLCLAAALPVLALGVMSFKLKSMPQASNDITLHP
jgi:hypothetical protein